MILVLAVAVVGLAMAYRAQGMVLDAERERPLALENHRLRDTLAVRKARIGNMEAAYNMVQREADRHAIRALVAEGKLNQCEAVTY